MFFLVMRAFKMCSPGSFQIYSTVLLSYARPPDLDPPNSGPLPLTCFIIGSLYLLTCLHLWFIANIWHN